MALVFAIIGNEGRPILTTSLDPDTHFELISLAHRHQLLQILSLEDYYQDRAFTFKAMQFLRVEFQALQNEKMNVKLRQFLSECVELIDRAEVLKEGIEVIAD